MLPRCAALPLPLAARLLVLPALLALAACGGPESSGDDTLRTEPTAPSDPGTSADATAPSTRDVDSTDNCIPAVAEGPQILPSPEGALEGDTHDGTRRWLGVPYAAPPVGPLRWRPPAAAPCRERVLRLRQPAHACLQADPVTGDLSGQEDCLQLNLWAPEGPPPDEGWPILVFVHGGGNLIGSASQRIGQTQQLLYDGSALARRGHVVAVVNYRLGAAGWLALPDLSDENGGHSGNWALEDQQHALRWLRAHVPGIGGDPERILLFGESAGAVNVIAHLASPASAGLFRAAGIMSGVPTSRPLAEAEAQGDARAAATPCGAQPGAERLACLRALTPEELLAAFPGQLFVGITAIGAGTGSNYGPVVDGVILPEPPAEAIAAGRHHDVPVLLGTTAEEMAELLQAPDVNTREDLERTVRDAFRPLFGESGVDRILETYPEEAYDDTRAALVAVYSDFRFVCPALLLAEALEAGGSAPVFRYWFARRAETARGPLPAAHGRELVYLFASMYRIPFFSPVEDDREVGRQMEEAWSSMASDLAPVVNDGPAWAPWDPARDNAFVFDAPASILEGVRTAECAMWRELTGR
ncbi:MAG: hypothetical protein EA398_09445 [Deltaproteobacteria bacterium]|nr:MAG: hypothetical protein EA398_09445 [Deltaproteobacteria bacterium]